jgi:hypothetical protein
MKNLLTFSLFESSSARDHLMISPDREMLNPIDSQLDGLPWWDALVDEYPGTEVSTTPTQKKNGTFGLTIGERRPGVHGWRRKNFPSNRTVVFLYPHNGKFYVKGEGSKRLQFPDPVKTASDWNRVMQGIFLWMKNSDSPGSHSKLGHTTQKINKWMDDLMSKGDLDILKLDSETIESFPSQYREKAKEELKKLILTSSPKIPFMMHGSHPGAEKLLNELKDEGIEPSEETKGDSELIGALKGVGLD